MSFVGELIFIAVLLLTNFSLRQKMHLGRILSACVFVCSFAGFFPVINLGGVFLFCYRILTGLIVCVIATNLKLRQFLLYFLVYLIHMFVLFGVGDFVSRTLGGADIWLRTSLMALFSVVMVKIINLFYAKKRIHNFVYKVSITVKKTIKINAFLDSGNGLKDPETGIPIVIINLRAFVKLFGVDAKSVMKGKLTDHADGRYVECNTIAGGHKIFVFEPKSITVEGRSVTALVGLSLNNFGAEFDCLLNRYVEV
jgi:hypothetical protein